MVKNPCFIFLKAIDNISVRIPGQVKKKCFFVPFFFSWVTIIIIFLRGGVNSSSSVKFKFTKIKIIKCLK